MRLATTPRRKGVGTAKSACCYHAAGRPAAGVAVVDGKSDRTFQLFSTRTSLMRRQDGAKAFDCEYHSQSTLTSRSWMRNPACSCLHILDVCCSCHPRDVATDEFDLDHALPRRHELNEQGLIFDWLDSRSTRPWDLDITAFKLEHDLPLYLGCHTPSNR